MSATTPGFTPSDRAAELRDRVRAFIEERIIPAEPELDAAAADVGRSDAARSRTRPRRRACGRSGIRRRSAAAGCRSCDYVYVNEVVGRSEHAMVALGTHSLQDSIMLNLYAIAGVARALPAAARGRRDLPELRR